MTTRRTHTKSRNGCKECKRRKVKCDETYPTCFHCSRHGVLCSLSERQTIPPPPDLSSSNGHDRLSHHNDIFPWYKTPSVSPAAAFSGLSHLLDPARLLGAVSAGAGAEEDSSLELMHHYCNYTCNTFSYREDMRHVWRVIVPEFGYSSKYVMHGLLCMAALHKAHLMPSQRERYLDLSAYYQTLGVQRFVSELQHLSEDNWKHAFSFSSSIVIYAFCLPAIKKEIAANHVQNIVDMLMFVRGMRAVLASWQGQLAVSQLAPLVKGNFPIDEKHPAFRKPAMDLSPLPNDLFKALDSVAEYYRNTLPEPRQPEYLEAVRSMTSGSYLAAHAGMSPEMGWTVFWIYGLPDKMIADVQAADPAALVLLAYFAVLVSVIEPRFWFLQGWPKILFAAIDSNLPDDEEFLKMISWPRKQVMEVYRTV